MGSLKQFVKAVRKAKTIADERTVVRKESAAIRTAFRDPNLDQDTRRTNIAKLLYLYILGEKTHFGQVECLKLLALPRFADKRLGYLATMLLLDENQEVLTLLTNLLDNDMQHPNVFVAAQALCCLGNVASAALARDLHANVDNILATTNSVYLKKKACLVAARLIEKDPDLAEVFSARIGPLISDKTPLVVLGTCRMVQAIYQSGETAVAVNTLPRWMAHLRRVLSAGYMPDYDVGGVTDPFLQVSLLNTIRTLATDPQCVWTDEINDLLTQVCLGVDAGKNAAHAVLYECVRTIFTVKADQLLRVLGVNVLGRFLGAKDNNTRYVALESLLAVAASEPQTVQRHRATIVACLGDADVLIRRRALELTFAIVTDQNVRVLMREILAYMAAKADPELTAYVASHVVAAAAAHAPTAKWHFDTLVRMLRVAGSAVGPDMVASVLALVAHADPDLRAHVVGRVLAASAEASDQYGLAVVAVWCVGEYAEQVVGTKVEINGSETLILEEWVLAWLDGVLAIPTFTDSERSTLTCYAMTAATKMLVKFGAAAAEHLRMLVCSRTHDPDMEIQTRAAEYEQLWGVEARLKHGVLAHVPPPPLREHSAGTLQGTKQEAPKVAKSDELLDLLDVSEPSATSNDVLSDIFGSGGTGNSSTNGLNGLNLGGNSTSNSGTTNISALNAGVVGAADTAFSNADIHVSFTPLSFTPGHAIVNAVVSPASLHLVDHVQLLIAVPKTQNLTMSTTSTDSLAAGPLTQVLKISGKEGARIKLRVKVKYNVAGTPSEAQFDYAGFPETL